MGLRGPKPVRPPRSARRAGCAIDGCRSGSRRRRRRGRGARKSWRSVGCGLLTTKTPRLPTLKAALALFEAADAIWMRLHRLGDLASPAPPAPAAELEAYRRRRASN